MKAFTRFKCQVSLKSIEAHEIGIQLFLMFSNWWISLNCACCIKEMWILVVCCFDLIIWFVVLNCIFVLFLCCCFFAWLLLYCFLFRFVVLVGLNCYLDFCLDFLFIFYLLCLYVESGQYLYFVTLVTYVLCLDHTAPVYNVISLSCGFYLISIYIAVPVYGCKDSMT